MGPQRARLVPQAVDVAERGADEAPRDRRARLGARLRRRQLARGQRSGRVRRLAGPSSLSDSRRHHSPMPHKRIPLLQTHAASVCRHCDLNLHTGALVHQQPVAGEAQHVRREASDALCPAVPANSMATGPAGQKPCRAWRACAKLRQRNPDAGARASAARASSGVANTASAESSPTHLRAPQARQAWQRRRRADARPLVQSRVGAQALHGLL
jgi:hypothetical protein